MPVPVLAFSKVWTQSDNKKPPFDKLRAVFLTYALSVLCLAAREW